MLLIADSGSTKTDWRLKGDNIDTNFQTLGINPFYMSDDELYNEFKNKVSPKVNQIPDKIYFYGAGVITEQKHRIKNALLRIFPNTEIHAESDLLGAARALCGHEKGIACIMGTGANSCLYNGEKIIDNIPPLGFIQGDEGSGAVLGKKLITMYLKRELSDNIEKLFRDEYKLDTADILQKVYKEAFPNRFLANFSKFINKHINNEQMHRLVYDSFIEFLERNVYKYHNYKELNIHFVGSIAYYFNSILKEVFEKENLHMGKIIKTPLEALVNYHYKQK